MSNPSEVLHLEVALRGEGYIYRVTYLPTQETYVGIHSPRRGEPFLKYLGSGKRLQELLKSLREDEPLTLPRKEGLFLKEVLEVSGNPQGLRAQEKALIAAEKALGKGTLNTSPGGGGLTPEEARHLWRLPGAREARSKLMEEKWQDPAYALPQRAALQEEDVLQRIREGNRRTKGARRDAIAEKTRKQKHREFHGKTVPPRRLCSSCLSEGLAAPVPPQEEALLRKAFASGKKKRSLALAHGLTPGELDKILQKE